VTIGEHEQGHESHGHEHGDTQTSSHIHGHSHHRPHSPSHGGNASHADAPNMHLDIPRSHLRSRPNGLPSSDLLGVSSSRVHARSASMATFSSLSPAPVSSTIPHSQTMPVLASRQRGHRTHSRRAPSLQLHDAPHLGEGHANSPMTPNYRFGVDEHFASHQNAHLNGHTPNLHDHSHVHGSGPSREGHSHNMRGLFLHVMAVSTLPFHPHPLSPFVFFFRRSD